VNCERVLTLLEDYHYGEADRRLAAEVEAHLAACAECRSRLQILEQEDELYGSYSESLNRGLEVNPAMWDAIRPALAKEAPETVVAPSAWLPGLFAILPKARLARYAVFAAVVASLSIVGTLLTLRMFAPVEDRGANDRYAGSGSSLEAALHSVQRAETEYLQAIRILSDIVDRQKPSLDPGKRAELDRNLRALDLAIVKARQEYQAHPLDPELGFSMLAAYREKVELLQEAAS